VRNGRNDSRDRRNCPVGLLSFKVPVPRFVDHRSKLAVEHTLPAAPEDSGACMLTVAREPQ
jgi:hypothetical protein